MSKKKIEHTPSCGNVFADLGLENADELLAKSQLTIEIKRIIERRGLTQTQTAHILGTDQSYVSKLTRGHNLNSFSIGRLMRYLKLLDRDVRILIEDKPRRAKHGAILVGRQTHAATL